MIHIPTVQWNTIRVRTGQQRLHLLAVLINVAEARTRGQHVARRAGEQLERVTRLLDLRVDEVGQVRVHLRLRG